MKHIQQNSIVSISADYEDGNFPADNLLDDKPGRIWSAGGLVRNATLTIEAKAFDTVCIFGTNAIEASVSVIDPNEIAWDDGDEWGDGDEWSNVAISSTATITAIEWINALQVIMDPAVLVPCEISLNLTSPGSDTLYAGVVQAGIGYTYGGANFRYGGGESPVDKSITAENSNGSRYYKKRKVGRQLSLTALMLRTEADNLFKSFRVNGAIPNSWVLYDGISGSEDLIFGFISSLSRTADHLNHDTVNIAITEET